MINKKYNKPKESTKQTRAPTTGIDFFMISLFVKRCDGWRQKRGELIKTWSGPAMKGKILNV